MKAEYSSGESKYIEVFSVDDNVAIKFDGNYFLIGKMAPPYDLLLATVRSSQEEQ